MDRDRHGYSHSLDGSLAEHSEVLDFETGYGVRQRSGAQAGGSRPLQAIELQDKPDPNLPQTTKPSNEKKKHVFSLGGKRHLSLRSQHLKGFSFTRSHKRQAIARDWSPGRKRFVASVSCLSTALIGIIVGIYAGETPAIQYYIVDFHHYTVLGNVFFFIGLAVPTFLFWPLPLLHGRKPYILGSMSLAMPLLFPQALAVGEFRSPYVAVWRIGLIMPRALMGFCLGFANMNFKAMLTDLFGASLQSQNPHQEHVDEFDVRRHGGGMGAWLGLWTWCSIGSIGFGFMIGALIINHLPPAWGFYVSIAIIAFVMLLNVLCPEVRRSAFRRSVAEVVKENAVSRRLARGEVKMHMVQSGPKWWGEEFHYGVMLSKNMLRQPGFLIMALYNAWIYGQMVLIISLLGALLSKDYKLKSPLIGASVMSLPIGALIAIPFQKASFFSRARNKVITSDDATLKKRFAWSSHMLRRSIFVLCLPVAGMAYTLSSGGPPIPFALPIIFAGIIGFLSSLALAECSGIIMETFDTSDLQPGMTGRPRGSSGDKTAAKRTNYSSFPRVQSAFAMCSGFGYLIAAAASGVGGSLTRHLGQQAATGIMAGILLVLSLLLLATLVRFTDIQIIPDSKKDEMEQYHQARRASKIRREEGIEEEEPWRPVIIGNPHHTTRRMCLLELGSMSRFSEIRRKNKLVDEKSLEAKHPNRAAIEDVRQYMHHKEHELRHKVSQSLSRGGSRGSRQSRMSDGPEQGDLGGHREMLNRGGSGKGSRRGAPESGRKGTSTARKVIEEHE
ncbi:MFS general substrate transporter [Mollisia scopiformis]|uniref:MFS general substrate transporter n=1 Tax=Mollisia scopiformis TaxID=149040 RepID=A0A194XCL7_MOLSC|nr:MFS general substrate transporter [Mollisia scopiformis]KUJ17904.1 MFS general substrate transporter [Mollisia scopiformis]